MNIDHDDRKICHFEMIISQGKFSAGRDYAKNNKDSIRRSIEFTGNSKPVISVLITNIEQTKTWACRLQIMSLPNSTNWRPIISFSSF